MVTLTRDGDDLVITLSTSERVEAVGLNAEIHLSVATVRDVAVIENPIHEIHGLRPRHFKITGTHIPGRTAVGTFLDASLNTRLFAAVHSNQRGLRIHLDEGTRFNDVMLTLDDPEGVAVRVRLPARSEGEHCGGGCDRGGCDRGGGGLLGGVLPERPLPRRSGAMPAEVGGSRYPHDLARSPISYRDCRLRNPRSHPRIQIPRRKSCILSKLVGRCWNDTLT
ncbi:hypothetical protein [Ferrimicrobium acidiphilum]|uniref:Uncharacterized protein n=1 Tax=Ferrimicrobium acidiphilum DSM 19497 TaxID=1121877 RepID=A0A0D8FSG7_9ACTN|nr:hypothetical protein [Ferrimicrobium acidiphilum]KJE76208.1 hypothetical protein FEAC_20700 [Ferrimicrobium acidiphilum DSM 19497]